MKIGFLNKFFNKKILVIAEKYDVARLYAETLNCKSMKGYFEGDKYVIVYTNGHIATLYNPEDYNNKFKYWRIEDLPILPNGFWVKVRENRRSIVGVIKQQLNREDITAVCIATDSAREGNLIGEYLLMAIENKKKVYRVMISAPNKKSIIKGFKEMEAAEKYKNLTIAAQARDEVDWIIGVNLSRAYSAAFKRKYYIGRCKTVILSLLCKKEDEILNSKQKIYYKVMGSFSSDKCSYMGKYDTEVNTLDEANVLKNLIGYSGKIEKIYSETKSVSPERLFNLNDLLRAANRRYGYASEETYNLAQNLYEKYKLISYARTDSHYIKSDMVNEIKKTLICIKNGKLLQKNCDINNMKAFTKRCVDDSKVSEHSAIVPLNIEKDEYKKVMGEIPSKELNIYKLIVENFINNFFEDYIYESKKIITKIDSYKFITNVQVPISLGWKTSESEVIRLDLKEGDRVNCNDISIEKKLTSLPARYNDDMLLAILENPSRFVEDKIRRDLLKEHGIGTDATRALLIQDLIDKEYVIRKGREIIPTMSGQDLIAALKSDKLKEPFFTAEIEEQLQLIEEGKKDKDELIKWVMKLVEEEVNVLKDMCGNVRTIGVCPKCHTGSIVETKDGNGYGCTNLKESINCRFYIAKYILGVTLDTKEVSNLITERQTSPFMFLGKEESFYARIVLDTKNNTKFKRV